MVQDWQFVSSQPSGSVSNPKARKLVRENAMRSFRRKQRLQRVAEFQQQRVEQATSEAGFLPVSVAGTVSHLAGMQENLPPDEDQDERAFTMLKLSTSLESGPGAALDPFHSTAMYSSNDAPRLFMHFVREMAPMINPFGAAGFGNPIVSLWPQYIIQDSTTLECLLFHSAVHVDRRNGRPWTASTWYHRVRCVELVNQRLALSVDDATSDCLIGAVSLLMTTGNITGDVDEDSIHRKALRRMVEMRGGLDKLGCDGLLALSLPIGDLIASSVSDSVPMLDPPNMNPVAAILDLDIGDTFARPASSSLGLASFRTEVFTLILFTSKLAALHADSIDFLLSSTVNMVAFTQLCSGVEHRLLSIRLAQHCRRNAEALAYEAGRIAGVMCMTYLFRGMNRTAAIFVNLHRRLCETIEDLESLSVVIVDLDAMRLLLWAVAVGSLTALDLAWFSRRIRKGIATLEIMTLEELSSCLSCFVWTSRMSLDFLQVWEQIDQVPHIEQSPA